MGRTKEARNHRARRRLDEAGLRQPRATSGAPPFGAAALVSVVVPTRNRRALLARAVASVRAQSYPNWELLIVDDGSDDGSREMIEALGEPRLRWIAADGGPRGAGRARHRGAGLTRGDFVAFLDSDDWWLPDKLWLQLAAAEALGGARLVLIGPPVCDDGRGYIALAQPPLLPDQRIADYVYAGRQATVLSSCLLISGDFARRVRFDAELDVNQDTDYLLRLEREGARFHALAQPLYVLDTRRRGDRISYNPALRRRSQAWAARVGADWPAAVRRGYLLWDLSLRCACTGQRWLGLLHFARGFSLEAGAVPVFRQFLRIVGGGEVPAPVRPLLRASTQALRRMPRPPQDFDLAGTGSPSLPDA